MLVKLTQKYGIHSLFIDLIYRKKSYKYDPKEKRFMIEPRPIFNWDLQKEVFNPLSSFWLQQATLLYKGPLSKNGRGRPFSVFFWPYVLSLS